MVPFGGWEMPLAYPSGTVAEHLACRRRAVVFDVSHLGTVRVVGGGSLERLQSELSNDLLKIAPGRAQYTHLLDAESGGVLDDCIVWWVDDRRFDVMPNASNTERVRDALGGTDVTAERVVLAVQGPHARRLLAGVCADAAEVPRFDVCTCSWEGTPLVVAGTGYTGEDGVECAVPPEAAQGLWSALLGAGLQPAGLGARDTLRLEAGLPLHGHELGPGITPLQAGLGWVVGWSKGGFRGRAALEAERASGPRRRLRGVRGEARQPLRDGAVLWSGGRRVGELTSGSWSPVLRAGIGLGLVDSGVAPGEGAEVEVRGR
ncbi:MAG: glycine cleavage system aminomethyltransferase GcvT, partial [Acidimicrobiales bacterium]